MGVRLQLDCDGCFAMTILPLGRREFFPFNGKGHGFGVWKNPSIEEAIAPSGWVWNDPFTGCTYCPSCWNEIVDGDENDQTAL